MMFISEDCSTRKNPSTVHVSVPSKRRIARTFGRKAAVYDRYATFQTGLIKRLVARLAHLDRPGGRWIDLGCGTGILAHECRKAGISSRIVNIDFAFDPLCIAGEQHAFTRLNVQADIDDLPFKKELFDVAITASSLQWLADASNTLSRIAAIVKSRGFLAFSVFVRGSFSELFSIQRQFGIPAPVHCFEAGDFVRMLEKAEFVQTDYETVQWTAYAPEASVLIKNISAMGGTATTGNLLNRKELSKFYSTYENSFRTGDGIPLTYRAIVGVCRKRL